MLTPIRARIIFAVVSGAASLAASAVHAETRLPLDQTFNLSVGAFLFETDTQMRVDGATSNRGTAIQFDDEFGFQDQTRVRIDGYWRFAQRHKARFMYFTSRSESRREIAREIRFRDTTFPIDALVTAELDADVIELAYEYSVLKRDSFEVAATIGIHALSISADLTATLSSTGQTLQRSEEAEGDGPLPVIGVRALWALSDHFYFDAQAQFFALEIDNYDGSLHDYKISFVWQPLQNFGIGVGYNDFVTRLDVADDRFDGRLEFEYGGALAFLTVAF